MFPIECLLLLEAGIMGWVRAGKVGWEDLCDLLEWGWAGKGVHSMFFIYRVGDETVRIGPQEQLVAFISLVLATSHHSFTCLSLYGFTPSTRVLNLIMDFLWDCSNIFIIFQSGSITWSLHTVLLAFWHDYIILIESWYYHLVGSEDVRFCVSLAHF